MIGYWLLRVLSRPPGTADYTSKGYDYEPGHEFDYALAAYPDLLTGIAGKLVIDYGSGTGAQSVAFVQAGAREVLAIEPQRSLRFGARQRAIAAQVHDRITFRYSALDAEPKAAADLIFSENSIEHMANPGAELERMARLLAPGGRIVIVFPPWFSPEGAHCQHFTRLRWVNVFFRIATMDRVAALYRSHRAGQSAIGCNRLTLARFEWLAWLLCLEHGLTVRYQRLDASGGLPHWLTRVPWVREMFTSRATWVFERPAEQTGQPASQADPSES